MTQNLAFKIVEKLWKLNRIFFSADYDDSLRYLSQSLPFKIHEYRTSEPYKGWVIPPKWDLVKGEIRYKGKTILEVKQPLEIIGLSRAFRGTVSLTELKKHLHYDHRNLRRIPYHFRQHYRPWDRDWGFCVTQQFYDGLAEGAYDVEIITEESEGYLKVAEYIKEGSNPKGFAFVAHLDHPGMANDDLSGVAVGTELFHRLSQLDTKFTYRFVVVQEIIGSVFYLDQTMKKSSDILESCFLEMLGSRTELALQSSQFAKSQLENTIEDVLKANSLQFRSGPFRSIICNDEVVWESHGIPMCSLSRFPYPEYHSDQDNLAIISPESLAEAVELLYKTVQKLDKMTLMEKKFESVFSLAHPQYNLYVDPGQPAFGGHTSAEQAALRSLMDEIALLPQYTFVDGIAERLELPLDVVKGYLQLWENNGLITLT